MRISVALRLIALPCAIAEQTFLSSFEHGQVFVDAEILQIPKVLEDFSAITRDSDRVQTTISSDNRILQCLPALYRIENIVTDGNATIESLTEVGMNANHVPKYNDGRESNTGALSINIENITQIRKQNQELRQDLNIELEASIMLAVEQPFLRLESFLAQCGRNLLANWELVNWRKTVHNLIRLAQQITRSCTKMWNMKTNSGLQMPKSDCLGAGAWYRNQPTGLAFSLPEGDAVHVAGFAGVAFVGLAASFFFLG